MQVQEEFTKARGNSNNRPRRRPAYGVLAVLLLIAACVGTWWQLSTPPTTGTGVLGWFLRPMEGNAALRLPALPSALTSVEMIGDKGWAVGLGGTIVSSDDGGKTWKPGPHIVAANLRSVRFQRDGKRGWAVGDRGTVLRTEDGGDTWSDLSPRPGLDDLIQFVDVERNETTNQVWALGNDGTMLVSTDNAESWRKKTILGSGLWTLRNTSSMFFSQDGRHAWITAEGSILFSTDGGENWRATIVISTSDQARRFKSVWFAGRYGWAVGADGIIVSSSDYGQNWSLPHASGTTATLNAVAGSAEGIWAAGERGTLLFSRDGLTWTLVESGTTADLNSLVLSGNTRLDAALMRPGSIGKQRARQMCELAPSRDGVLVDLPGGPDEQRSTPNPLRRPPLIPQQVQQNDENAMPPLPEPSVISLSVGQVLGKLMGNDHGVAVGDAGTIVHRSNTSSPWAPVASAAQVLLRSVEVSKDGKHVYAFAESGLILESSDGGDSWNSSTPAGQPRLNGSSTSDNGSTWVVGDNGTMLSTSGTDSNWITHTSTSTADLQDIDFAPGGEVGIAVGKGTSTLFTTDGGKNWTSGQQSLSEGDSAQTRDTFRSVHVHDEGERAWAVGDRGLLARSDDRGATWTLSSELPSPAERTLGGEVSAFSVNLSAIQFSNDGMTGWLAGDDGIIAQTVDGGWRWHIRNRLEGVSLTSLHMARDDQHGWAAGNGGVLLKTADGGVTWKPVTTKVGSTRLAMSMDDEGKTGWIVGYPPALLGTKDAGSTWEPVQWPLRYWYFPAPWFWLAVMVAAWLIWAMFRPTPPNNDKSAAAIAITDAPTADEDQDKLGFAPLARGISRFLRNTRTEPPLTVAISGGWGSGKSSLMSLICQDLRRYDYRPVWFNAWHHQSEEQLLASLLNAIRLQGLPRLLSLDGCAFRVNLLYIRSRSHLLLTLLLVAAVSFLLGYMIFHPNNAEWSTLWQTIQSCTSESCKPPELTKSEAAPLLGQLAAVLVVWKTLSTALKAFGVNPAVLLTNAASRFRISEAQAQTSFRTIFSRQFAEVTEALPYRTVIVIDDLDRCRPETILTVLEAVNFLVTSGKCVVIFGMETRYIRAALGLHFEKFAEELALHDTTAAAMSANDRRWLYAGKYLEKLVNLEIKVPQQGDLSPLLPPVEDDNVRATSVVRKMLHRWPLFLLLLVAVLGAATAKLVNVPEIRPVQAPVTTTDAPVSSLMHKIETPPAMTETSTDVVQPSSRISQPALPLSPVHVQNDHSSIMGIASVALVILAFACYAAGVVLYRIRTSMRQINDSGAFKQALHAWLPLVQKRHATPRALKRFINRIRYLVMLQEGEQSDRSLFDEFRSRHHANPLTTRSQAVTEHRLVALGAFHDLYEDDWRHEVEVGLYPQEIDEVIAAYKKATKSDWPPGKDELDAFENSLKGVRVAGEADIIQPASTAPDSSTAPEEPRMRK